MKNLISNLVINLSFGTFILTAQVDIQPNAIAINDCNPLSELSVNSIGNALNTIHVEADANSSQSSAIYAKAFDVTSFGGFANGIVGAAEFGNTANRIHGVMGSALRTANYSDGRSTGVYGQAGYSTPGANYGVMGRLIGGNSGAGVVGYDGVNYGGWSQVLSSTISYAGYFRGKGYFHDNLGIGEEDPKEKLHVKNGNIYVEGAANGVILDSGGGGCFLISVDGSGNLSTTPINCP